MGDMKKVTARILILPIIGITFTMYIIAKALSSIAISMFSSNIKIMEKTETFMRDAFGMKVKFAKNKNYNEEIK